MLDAREFAQVVIVSHEDREAGDVGGQVEMFDADLLQKSFGTHGLEVDFD